MIRTADAQFVSMKLADGTHRYSVGDLVVHLEPSTLLTRDILRLQGCWDDEAGRGTLKKGSLGNMVTASRFAGVMSDGMLMPASEIGDGRHEEGTDLSCVMGLSFHA